jgi:predicted enzyme related to lactoylglutathione lyase
MSSSPKPCVVLFVEDVQHMSDFYATVAAMSVEHDAADHVVLESHGVQLVIHGIPVHLREPRADPTIVVVREDSYFKVCLPVHSIATARERAAALGGRIAPVAHEWEARGFRACDGNDPEGNVLQVREAAD